MLYYKFFNPEPIYYFCEIDYVFKTEQWLPVVGFELNYAISDLGRIKSIDRNYVDKNGIYFHRAEKILITHINKGYLKIHLRTRYNRKSYFLHQLVGMSFLNHTICGHELVINHKNFIRDDNRKINLEIVTHRENANKKHIKSTSKYVGVFWVVKRSKWMAKIEINGKAKSLGFFTDEKEASEYYQNALIAHNSNMPIITKKHLYASKYKGVSWDKFNNKWRAKAYMNKKAIYLGRHKTEIEANNAIIDYHKRSSQDLS